MRLLKLLPLILLFGGPAYSQGRVCGEHDAAGWETMSRYSESCEKRPIPDHEFIHHATYCRTPDGNFLILQLRERNFLYYSLPPDVWNEFISAESLGRFFNLKIMPVYKCSREK